MLFSLLCQIACKDACSKADCPGACLHGECFCDEETLCRGETCNECPEIILLPPVPLETVYPTLISGDAYLADSVFQNVSLEIEAIGQSIVAKIVVHFIEIGNDSSEAFGEWIIPIHTLGAEYELIDIESETLSSCLAIDYSSDVFICSGSESRPVNRFHITALRSDTLLPSFGLETPEYAHVKIVLNTIKLKVYRLS